MSSTAVPSANSRRADGSSDLTSEGTADTTAVAGAAGTDITASTAYGSRKSPDGANDVRHQPSTACAGSVFGKIALVNWSIYRLSTAPMLFERLYDTASACYSCVLQSAC